MKKITKKKIKKGKFIVIEGDDGSGKSSAIDYLKKKFGGRKDVVFSKEPGGTLVGDKIRTILQDKENEDMSVMTDLLLYSASRAENIEKVILPALNSGVHVICDRFDLSTLAYQIYARGRQDYLKFFEKLNKFVIADCKPDLYLFLDVSPEIGAERSRKRGEELSRFDAKSIEFHSRVRDGYRVHLRQKPHKIIDTNCMSLEDVRVKAHKIIVSILKIK
ncbi:MAG: Thymidylate kinase [Parcubacteria group bacterium GW2011_GWF2_38_76]|nr:MAG: Thymidylate kinase [Parcubacteria group bacterium GW2011_GWF2_38_76]HBM45857.1 dTMP kinase [Patescibacteria group bacterium]